MITEPGFGDGGASRHTIQGGVSSGVPDVGAGLRLAPRSVGGPDASSVPSVGAGPRLAPRSMGGPDASGVPGVGAGPRRGIGVAKVVWAIAAV